jgi:uracil-DNA glycosylase
MWTDLQKEYKYIHDVVIRIYPDFVRFEQQYQKEYQHLYTDITEHKEVAPTGVYYGRCERCDHKKGKTIIPGYGKQTADIMLVGDTPSPEDMAAGYPFCGDQANLLKRMFHAIGCDLNDVYRTMLVKCGVPHESLSDQDIDECAVILREEIRQVAPKVIMIVGERSACWFFRRHESLFKLRGKLQYYQEGTMMIASLPPALLIKNTRHKRYAWTDLQIIRDELARPWT